MLLLAGGIYLVSEVTAAVIKTANILTRNLERYLGKHPRKSNTWNIECYHQHGQQFLCDLDLR